MIILCIRKCEVCNKLIEKNCIEQMAGFPERIHFLCSNKCLRAFLRMEDDELEYRKLNYRNHKQK